MNRESAIIYRSFIEAIRLLPDEYRAEAYDALFAYALDGEEYAGDNSIIKAVLLLVAPQIDANNKRYENGCKGAEYGKLGGRPKKENPEETPKKPQENPKETPNDNVNDNDNDKENIPPKPPKGGKRFTPPSVEDVREYVKSRSSPVDPEAFCDFYTAKGWKVGNQTMKDWKAAVRTWEKRKTEAPGRASPFLERKLDSTIVERGVDEYGFEWTRDASGIITHHY